MIPRRRPARLRATVSSENAAQKLRNWARSEGIAATVSVVCSKSKDGKRCTSPYCRGVSTRNDRRGWPRCEACVKAKIGFWG